MQSLKIAHGKMKDELVHPQAWMPSAQVHNNIASYVTEDAESETWRCSSNHALTFASMPPTLPS